MLPSGKHTKNYGKSPFLMGKSTINHHFQWPCLFTRGYDRKINMFSECIKKSRPREPRIGSFRITIGRMSAAGVRPDSSGPRPAPFLETLGIPTSHGVSSFYRSLNGMKWPISCKVWLPFLAIQIQTWTRPRRSSQLGFRCCKAKRTCTMVTSRFSAPGFLDGFWAG